MKLSVRVAWITLGAAVTVVVALTLVAFTVGGPTALDRSVSSWVAGHRTARLVWVMHRVTLAGSAMALWGVAAVCVVIGLVRRRWEPLLVIVPTALAASLTTNLMKLAVGRPRPPQGIALHHFFGSSFPSGHATTAAALWGAVALVVVRSGLSTRRAAVVACGSCMVLVSASRVVLGAHWLTDVAAGTAVGVAYVALAVLALGDEARPIRISRRFGRGDRAPTDRTPVG